MPTSTTCTSMVHTPSIIDCNCRVSLSSDEAADLDDWVVTPKLSTEDAKTFPSRSRDVSCQGDPSEKERPGGAPVVETKESQNGCDGNHAHCASVGCAHARSSAEPDSGGVVDADSVLELRATARRGGQASQVPARPRYGATGGRPSLRAVRRPDRGRHARRVRDVGGGAPRLRHSLRTIHARTGQP